MSIILFRLRGVPDDEAEEVRKLLEENNLDYYETPAGKWGISMAAIWLEDDTQLERAEYLLEQYQAARAERIRAEYKKLEAEGKAETLIDKIKQEPIRLIVYLALIFLIIYLSIKPFTEIGR